MTNQEAIKTIKTAIAEVEWEYPMDYAVAFDMAIKALSTDGDLISRKSVIKLLDNAWVDGTEYQGYLHDRINALPSAQPDAYERGWEDGRKALREEMWEDERDRLD